MNQPAVLYTHHDVIHCYKLITTILYTYYKLQILQDYESNLKYFIGQCWNSPSYLSLTHNCMWQNVGRYLPINIYNIHVILYAIVACNNDGVIYNIHSKWYSKSIYL